MASGFPLWYTDSLKATAAWHPVRKDVVVLTKMDGTTFEFERGTLYSLAMNGKTGQFKVAGIFSNDEEAALHERGPKGLYFQEWNGTEWLEPFTRPMTMFPSGARHYGYIVDWNSVAAWSMADPVKEWLEKNVSLTTSDF